MVGVDIFLPSFNHGRFLKQRIESILNQTHSNFNLYVFDDCSTDNSLKIINGFRYDRRLRAVYVSEQPSGSPFGNWQRFLPLIKEDYVWIAESDDYASPDFLNLTLKELQRSDTSGMAVARSKVIDQYSKCVADARDYFSAAIEPIGSGDLSTLYGGTSVIRGELINRNPFPNISAILFKSREFTKAIAIELPRFYFLRDWLLYQQILSVSDVVIVKPRINYFRFHRDTTRRGEKPKSDWIRLMHERLFVCEDACRRVDITKLEADKHLQNIFDRMSARMMVYTAFKKVTQQLNLHKRPIFIYGAGSLGDQIFSVLSKEGFEGRIKGFIDRCGSNSSQVCFNGMPVYGPEIIPTLKKESSIIVASIEFNTEIVDLLAYYAFEGEVLKLVEEDI